MLKVNLEENKDYKMVKYKSLEAGEVFLTSDDSGVFEDDTIYIKTEKGRIKTDNFYYISDDKDDKVESEELVYLLEAELNVKRILN
jgi:hypothetical protein